MLRSAALLTCTVLLASPSIAQSKLEATDIATHPFSADALGAQRARGPEVEGPARAPRGHRRNAHLRGTA